MASDIFRAAKKAGQTTCEWEAEIDTLFYGRYGLTDEEIAIVGGQAKPAAANS